MKILGIHNYYRVRGGEDAVVVTVGRLLTERGHEVLSFERDSKFIVGTVRRINAGISGIYCFFARKEVKDILSEECPDVVHVNNLYPLISHSVLDACKEASVPVVMTCHNYRLFCPAGKLLCGNDLCKSVCHGREYRSVFRKCLGNYSESVSYAARNTASRLLRSFSRNVAVFVTPSEFVKRKLIENGFPEDRISVIPNMVSLPSTSVDPEKGEYVAYSGRVSPEKGISCLLESLAVTGLPGRIAGDCSAMQELSASAPPNVRFLGRLDEAQLGAFYRGARFSVVPSIWHEAFGIVAAEAMSHGLPVIASTMGGLPEVVTDGETGLLFEAGNAEELSNKMLSLWQNPELCKKMGESGRMKALKEYSEEMYYDRLMAVYNHAIDMVKGSSNDRL
jgi:glycosyltransferase involved in cell wall biosynthesis